MILNDRAIRELSSREGYLSKTGNLYYLIDNVALIETSEPMIEPFSEGVSEPGVISYGLTSGGYDLRLGEEMLEYTRFSAESYKGRWPIDPFQFGDEEYKSQLLRNMNWGRSNDNSGRCYFTLAPGAYALGRSVEYIRIPRRIVGTCVGKSTYARCGILVNCTPLEPEWKGFLTIEIANLSPRPVKLYIGQGIAQLRFELLIADPEKSYADKKGIYQGQTGVTVPRVRETIQPSQEV